MQHWLLIMLVCIISPQTHCNCMGGYHSGGRNQWYVIAWNANSIVKL